MKPEMVALAIARGRIAFGTAALVMPGMAARLMGRGEEGGIAPLFARMVGGRDIALGLGTVIALDRGKPVRGWIEGSAMADAVDGVAAILAREQMSSTAFVGTVAIAASAAAAGLVLSRRLDPPPPAQPGQPEAVATGHPS